MSRRNKKVQADLRYSNIVSNPMNVDSASVEEAREYVMALRSTKGGPKISDLFAQEQAIDSIDRSLDEFGPLISQDGELAILRLHQEPMVEVELENEVHLLGAIQGAGGVSVLTARWVVDRLPNRVIRSGTLVEVDEFLLPRDALMFEKALLDLASATGFTPRNPRLRGVGIVTSQARRSLTDGARDLAAAAAIYDVEMDVLPDGDPSDQKFLDELDRVLKMNRYSVLAVLHDFEDWIWDRIHDYQTRPHRVALHMPAVVGSDETIRQVAARFDEITQSAPDIPALEWGADALARIQARTGGSFHLTENAEQHLLKNRYPKVERMLQFLERLADLADAFAMGQLDGGRLADHARVEFDLEIALFDSNIPESSAIFMFDGVELDNRPHVKVDDYKSPADCGRIYFGFDSTRGWIVVDHIGLHDRY